MANVGNISPCQLYRRKPPPPPPPKTLPFLQPGYLHTKTDTTPMPRETYFYLKWRHKPPNRLGEGYHRLFQPLAETPALRSGNDRGAHKGRRRPRGVGGWVGALAALATTEVFRLLANAQPPGVQTLMLTTSPAPAAGSPAHASAPAPPPAYASIAAPGRPSAGERKRRPLARAHERPNKDPP